MRAFRWLKELGSHKKSMAKNPNSAASFHTEDMIDYVWGSELGEGFQ